MKLLILTAVKDFEDEIKKMLLKSDTNVFSYMPAIGYKNMPKTGLEDAWFSGHLDENDAIIFMAFVPTENVDLVYEKVQAFNDADKFSSRIHLATINLEKTI